ncbi:MAG: hypothetical protein ORN58_04945, partial [Sediminibacterium sp.]|nr:hypothetical protein [Sediminibacterium sp.]
MLAWGDNSNSQCNIPIGLSNVVQLSGGAYHSLALKLDGTVIGWGKNENGQIFIPFGLNNVVQIAAGGSHSVALKSDGTVVAWGYNAFGQINIPIGLNNVVQIAVGTNHSLALKLDGTVVAWGTNWAGQTNIPDSLANVVQITGGGNYNLALKENSNLVSWGIIWVGQTNIPDNLNNIIQISGGGTHNLALKRDGTIFAWGNNGSGQITIPAGLNNVVQVSGGGDHSLALKSNGNVVAWGNNDYGQITLPDGLNNVIQISGGGSHSLSLSKLQLITTSNAGGTISPAIFVKNGDTKRITYQPNPGYFIDSIFINGVLNKDSLSGFTFYNINKYQIVRVVYKSINNINPQLLEVNTSFNSGGTISPTLFVKNGDTIRITYKPNTGYLLDSVIVNGIYVGKINSYTFYNVKGDSNIRVTFKIQTFIITTTAGNGGNINSQGTTNVNYGTRPTYTFTPNTGYVIDSVTVNGLKVSIINNSYRFDSVKSNQTIQATFKLQTFIVISKASVGGTISPQGTTTVNYATRPLYTITPNIGYELDSIFINGVFDSAITKDSINGYT